MDRAEATGFGVALAGHGLLLAVLLVGFAAAKVPPPQFAPTMEVSFVEEVGLVSAAPVPNLEPPAPSVAPEIGVPDEAAPAPEPEPAPPQPEPAPTKAAPAPKQAAPVPSPERARPQPAREQPAPANRKQASAQERPRGSRLGPDLLKGIGRDPSPSRETRPTGAAMSSQAVADIASAITRQVQPCADRQVDPGPGANRIVTAIQLQLNRDGSLAARPRVVRQSGIDEENRRYADRVADLAIASFAGCAPLRGLPQELYDVPRGWRNFTMNYRLPG